MSSSYTRDTYRIENLFKRQNYLTNHDLLFRAKLLKYCKRHNLNSDIGDIYEKHAFASHINKLSYSYGKFYEDVNNEDVEEYFKIENYLTPYDLARKLYQI